VYKILGEHEHIVKHYGGTFRGSEGHASIFMEKCGTLKLEFIAVKSACKKVNSDEFSSIILWQFLE